MRPAAVLERRGSGYGSVMSDNTSTSPSEDRAAVDVEVAEQAAIDRSDAEPAEKVAARDAARDALEERVGVEPEPGPNPS